MLTSEGCKLVCSNLGFSSFVEKLINPCLLTGSEIESFWSCGVGSFSVSPDRIYLCSSWTCFPLKCSCGTVHMAILQQRFQVMCLPLVLLCSSGDSKANLRSHLSPALEKENALCLCLKKNICCDKLWGSLPSRLVSVPRLFPSRITKRLEGKCGRSRLRPGQQEDWKSGLVGSLGRLPQTPRQPRELNR